MLSKVVCVVASFEDDDHLRADLEQFSCHVVVGKRAELCSTNLVMDGCIKTTRDKDQIRFELSCDWQKKFFTCVFILIGTKCFPCLKFPSEIDVISFAFPNTDVPRLSSLTTWEEV